MDLATLTTSLPLLALVAIRLGGLVAFAPALGHAAVPAKVRFGIVVTLSLAVVARMAVPVALPGDAGALVLAGVGELMIGATIGLAARMVIAGVQLGALHVSQQMGLSLGEVFNPVAELGGPVRALFGLLAIVLFLAIGGQRTLISATLDTFQAVPPASAAGGAALLAVLVGVLASSFTLAIQVAAPVLAAMLLATAALGLLQKTVPQMNLLSTSLPIRAMLGAAVLATSLGVMQPLLAAVAKELTTAVGSLTATGI